MSLRFTDSEVATSGSYGAPAGGLGRLHYVPQRYGDPRAPCELWLISISDALNPKAVTVLIWYQQI